MDGSKKPKPDRDLVDPAGASATLIAPLEDLLESRIQNQEWAVALSGGPDSAALAICAASLSKRKTLRPKLFHIHHGLQTRADAWQVQVQALARLLDLDLIVKRVQVDLTRGTGMEAAARTARHAALHDLAAEHKISAVVFAHHLEDQAETVLQRLFRGAGVTGLGAMRVATKNNDCWWLRPWLGVSRSIILQYLSDFQKTSGWVCVDDPTNLDPSLGRGLIRRELSGLISNHWPGWQRNVARHAQQAQEAQTLLTEYGQLLLDRVRHPHRLDALDLRHWRDLTPEQQALSLRTWFLLAGVQMPTERRLAELCRQLNQVHALGHDRHLRWRQSDCEVTCIRGMVSLQVTI